jgi:small subunit ribosomal protein S1
MKQIAINDIGTAEDFLKAIDESMKDYSIGDAVIGVVVQIDRDGVLVDIGSKTEAFISKKEISAKRVFEITDILSIGQAVQATVKHIDQEGQYTLSMKEAEVKMLWDSIESIFNSEDKIVSGEIVKIIKGGMIVDIGVRAFLPLSQSNINRTEDPHTYIGQTIEAKIIQFEREKNNVVISRKALVENELKQNKAIHFSRLEVGQVHRGKVTGIAEFGVFVVIGLASGLIHKSKMPTHTPEQFAVGDSIDVKILEIDFDKDRLSLALKG